MDEIDIWRSAQLYIEKYGLHAEFQAGVRASEAKAAGDENGLAVWTAIFNAIEELRRVERNPNECIQ